MITLPEILWLAKQEIQYNVYKTRGPSRGEVSTWTGTDLEVGIEPFERQGSCDSQVKTHEPGLDSDCWGFGT